MTADDQTLSLLQRWHAGDRAALDRLIERDADWIRNRVRDRRGDGLRRFADTTDQFQDVVLELLEYSPRFVTKNRGQFRALLARMLENDIIDRRRRGERSRTVTLEVRASRISLDPAVARDAAPDAAAARNEELAWMRLAVEFLEPPERQLVLAHAFEGRSFVELGEEMDAKANTVRMQYHRAVVKLTGIVRRLQAGDADELLADD